MRLILAGFLLAAVGLAETPAKEKKKSPEELLEIAVGGMPTALQAVALMDLAGLPHWSPKQSTAMRVRAFEALVQSNVTEENPAPEMFVTAVLQRVAETDVTAAQALILRLPGSAGMVAARDLVVGKLVAEKRIEEAEQFINAGPGGAGFPMVGVGVLLKALAADDGRRVIWFARALDAFRDGASGFHTVFKEVQATMPRELRVKAADAILRQLEGKPKDPEGFRHVTGNEKGIYQFQWSGEAQAYPIIDALLEADPAATREFIKAHEGLRKAVDEAPAALQPGQVSMGGTVEAGNDLPWMRDNQYAARSAQLIATDFDGALALANQISDPSQRLSQLIYVYQGHPEKEFDAEALFDLLKQRQVGSGLESGMALVALLLARQRTADVDRAMSLLFAALEQMYREESDGEKGNGAWQGVWNSVQSARQLGYRLGAWMDEGQAADLIRSRLSNASLQTLARIQVLCKRKGVGEPAYTVGSTSRKKQ